MNRRGTSIKAKLFTATFRMMENIKEINVAEIFVALRGRDLSVVFSANFRTPDRLRASQMRYFLEVDPTDTSE